MGRGIDGVKGRECEDRFRRYADSQLTVGEFCVWKGVSVAAFYVWRKKLPGGKTGRRTARSPATAEVGPRSSGRLSRLSFLPVRVAERSRATADVPAPAVGTPVRTGLGDSAPATPACIEVRLTNAVRIFVPGIELDALDGAISAVGRLAAGPCDDAHEGHALTQGVSG